MPKRYKKNVHKRCMTKLKNVHGKSFMTEMEGMGGVVEGMRVVAVEIKKIKITDGIEARSYCFQVRPSTCQHLSIYLY